MFNYYLFIIYLLKKNSPQNSHRHVTALLCNLLNHLKKKFAIHIFFRIECGFSFFHTHAILQSYVHLIYDVMEQSLMSSSLSFSFLFMQSGSCLRICFDGIKVIEIYSAFILKLSSHTFKYLIVLKLFFFIYSCVVMVKFHLV